MTFVLGEQLRTLWMPPRYLALPLSGIDLSASGVKAVRLIEGERGLTLSQYAETRLPAGAYAGGEVHDPSTVVGAIVAVADAAGISAANVALPDRSPSTVNGVLAAFDQARLSVLVFEEEKCSLARALLLPGDTSTVLIVDIGKTTTKFVVVAGGVPCLDVVTDKGGHSLTLAIQKHFGVTETEARRVKVERGIAPAPGDETHLAALLSTLSVIRSDISRVLGYWEKKMSVNGAYEPVSHLILAGGNASLRGLPEYLEKELKLSVAVGDVFTNLSSRDVWVPTLERAESLSYATAIGLALRGRAYPYA